MSEELTEKDKLNLAYIDACQKVIGKAKAWRNPPADENLPNFPT